MNDMFDELVKQLPTDELATVMRAVEALIDDKKIKSGVGSLLTKQIHAEIVDSVLWSRDERG